MRYEQFSKYLEKDPMQLWIHIRNLTFAVNLLTFLMILVFFIGAYAGRDGMKPHPERPIPTGQEDR